MNGLMSRKIFPKMDFLFKTIKEPQHKIQRAGCGYGIIQPLLLVIAQFSVVKSYTGTFQAAFL